MEQWTAFYERIMKCSTLSVILYYLWPFVGPFNLPCVPAENNIYSEKKYIYFFGGDPYMKHMLKLSIYMKV